MKPSHMYRAQPGEKNWYYENLIEDMSPPRSHREKVLIRYYQRLARRNSCAEDRLAKEA